MKPSIRALIGGCVALALAGCQQDGADAGPAPTESPAAAAPAPAKAPRPDVLARDKVGVTLELASEPAMNPATGLLEIPVKVTNTGSVELSGNLQPPVNLGVQIMGDDGTATSAGGARDFKRVALPSIAPGASATVVAQVPVSARIDNRTLSLDVVQEGVAWFSQYGQPTLKVGPFKVCGTGICAEEPQG